VGSSLLLPALSLLSPSLPLPEPLSREDMRLTLFFPCLFPLIEYALVFVVGGFVLLINALRNNVEVAWSTNLAATVAIVWVAMWVIDLVLFFGRDVKAFYYTILTLGGRIVAGVVLNIYLGGKIDRSYAYLWLLMAITVIMGLLKALSKDAIALVFHAGNAVICISVLTIVGFGYQTNFFHLLGMAILLLFTQITHFHELDLAKNLKQITLQEWENEFIHIG